MDAQLIGIVATMVAGVTMVLLGERKRMLEAKRPPRRRCPSCGRIIEGRTCNRHEPA
jgi:hypothetical protein